MRPVGAADGVGDEVAQSGEQRVVRKIWIDAIERARQAGALGDIHIESIM